MRDKIRERFRALIGSYYVPEINGRGKRHGIKQWQEDHVRAKDATRGAKKRTGNPSILARFQEDEWYRNSQIEKLGWTEAFCRYLDYIVTIDISHQASQVQRHRYESTVHMKCGDSNRQLRPTRDDYHKATRALVTIWKEQPHPKTRKNKADKHITVQDRTAFGVAQRTLAGTFLKSIFSSLVNIKFFNIVEPQIGHNVRWQDSQWDDHHWHEQ